MWILLLVAASLGIATAKSTKEFEGYYSCTSIKRIVYRHPIIGKYVR